MFPGNNRHICLTFDIDWAPDYMISYVVDKLIKKNISSTWLVTHKTHILEDSAISNPDLFELGIHPNFMPNSTHGDSIESIIAHCIDLVPTPRVVRTHGYYQSWNILQKLVDQANITIDCSLYTPRQTSSIETDYFYPNGNKLRRVSTIWEDHLEISRPDTDFTGAFLETCSGKIVLNMHPVHIYLNTVSLDQYKQFRISDRSIVSADKIANRKINGPGTFLDSLINNQKNQFLFL